jgi:hypothetical protein
MENFRDRQHQVGFNMQSTAVVESWTPIFQYIKAGILPSIASIFVLVA